MFDLNFPVEHFPLTTPVVGPEDHEKWDPYSGIGFFKFFNELRVENYPPA
jgi:hypothetical protein